MIVLMPRLDAPAVSRTSDQLYERTHISDQRIALERETLQRSAPRLLVADAARVRNDDWDKPEVNGVSHCGLDADLESNPGDGDRFDPAVTQSHVQRSSLER